MSPTARDVAALAGVSVKTVSRVVNGEPHTRPEVVQRVTAAMAELGWTPSATARSLRTRRTGLVGIGVAELRRPYLATLVEALVAEADQRGIPVAVEPTHGDPDRTAALFAARGRVFDGLLHIGPLAPGVATQGALTDRPAVVIQGGAAVRDVDRVDEDVEAAVSLAARHLAVMGRGRPVLLGGDRARRPGEDPVVPSAAMRAALADAGLDASDVPLVAIDGVADRHAGADAAGRAVVAHPALDALLCVNDEVALGALAALSALGVDVPGQVAVIGHDDLDDGRFSTPSLTTIDPGPARLARVALELLGERLAGRGPEQARAVTLPVHLVRRESTLGEVVP
ncbi:LacI family DNA-binding transcriptional regulator [Cellulomonas shaoxiangyii]|uniref:LacI family transcriptional regulator n=1 Tax=Cellulomonas shaoxiangyii TaxID=2566013 RepID=A0A4P7SHN3_9CELL|nr:LacI family DNA-binding transcriptional regulator [Cellulomonas shaoxiangyii]QCB93542.1 LacI family transcriptional regulator [Cellulomonas shaoxiangyii]TGY86864.1 LacI family transcriptional regulator [Cellulomonas shaoxiangyii]